MSVAWWARSVASGTVNWVNSWLGRGLPGYCAFCLSQEPLESGWCRECFNALPWNRHACVQCKEPLGRHTSNLSPNLSNERCGHCLVSPPAFKVTTAELLYEGPVIELIYDFKFNGSPRAGALLVELMLANTPAHLGSALLPVPMFQARAKKRGFNQASWLASQLSKRLNVPVVSARCTKQLPSQRSLNRRQRMVNMVGAFQVVGPLPHHVTIIDDVVTTGATGHALAQAALDAGAMHVDIWAVARTPLDRN